MGFVQRLCGERELTGSRGCDGQTMMRHRSARASFPSGDSAGAATMAVSCMLVTGRWEWALLAVLSAGGRMFFHAHHLLDVLAGCAVGAGCTLGLHAALGDAWELCGWRHYACVQAAFLVVWRGTLCQTPDPALFGTRAARQPCGCARATVECTDWPCGSWHTQGCIGSLSAGCPPADCAKFGAVKLLICIGGVKSLSITTGDFFLSMDSTTGGL